MWLINIVMQAIVISSGAFLLLLGVLSLVRPSLAKQFLLGFAGSQYKHYIEMFVRLVTGAAFITYAPHMLYAEIFKFFGWLLVATTVGLLLIPWQWHQRFAKQTVPQAVRFITLIGVSSIAFGLFILTASFLNSVK
jgi:hypothetical protein